MVPREVQLKRLVIGPPGTGKTRKLSEMCAVAIQEHGPENVKVLSITKAAAREAASRVDLPDENVGTVHSCCFHGMGKKKVALSMLDKFNEEHGYNLTNASVETGGEPPSGDDATFGRIQINRARMTPRDAWDSVAADMYIKWSDFKFQTDSWDFSDMIETALSRRSAAPGNPRVIFFDEAQDASRLEFELLKEWAKYTDEVIAFGDDLQAIFEWRGGSVPDFLAFGDEITTLKKSWRLPSEIVKYAKQIEERVQVRYERDFEPRCIGGEVIRSHGSLGNGQWIEEIDGDTMVMASTNMQVVGIVKALQREKIPYHNPWRKTNGYWNPLARGDGKKRMPVDRIDAYLNPPWKWQDLRLWADCLTCLKRGAKKAFKERMGTVDLQEVREMFEEGSLNKLLSLDIDVWASFLDKKTRTKSLLYAIELEKSGRRGDPRVTVGTIHSLKGTEAETVILFPDISLHSKPNDDSTSRLFYVGCTRSKEKLVLCQRTSRHAIGW